MKTNRFFTAVGLLLFFCLCLVPSGEAQTECAQFSLGAAPTAQVSMKCSFTSTSTPFQFTAAGSVYWQIFWVPSGTVSAAAISLDSSASGTSWSTGGIVAAATIGSLATANSYANTSATTPTNFGQITPSITGSGVVTVVLYGYTNTPASSGSGSGGTVSVSNFPSSQAITGTVPSEVTAAWTSATTQNTALQINLAGNNHTKVFLNQGTTITGGVVGFQISDTTAFTNAYTIQCVPVNTSGSPTTTYTLQANTNQAQDCDVSGAAAFRVILSTAITGSATVNVGIEAMVFGAVPDISSQDASTGVIGNAVGTKGMQVAGKNGSGNLQALATDASGNVGVNIQNTTGTSGATNITASQCAAVAVGGGSQVSVAVSGTWTGTLQPKVSVDGTNYVNAVVYPIFPAGGSSASTITANGQWGIVTFGAQGAEVCGNTVATGTAVATVNTTPGTGFVVANIGLINGNAPLTGTGAGGSGALRVTVSNDSTEATDMTGTTPGTAPSSSKVVAGIYNSSAPAPTTGQTLPVQLDSSGNMYVAFRTTTNGCDGNNASLASINLNASGSTLTQIVALAAGKKIYVCAAYLQGGGTTPTFELEYGTGTNCGTGTTVLTQPIALTTTAPGISWVSPGPVVPVGDALCYILTGTTPTAVGWISYVQ